MRHGWDLERLGGLGRSPGELLELLVGDPSGARGIALALCLACLTGIAYLYLGYPLLLWLLARWRSRPLSLASDDSGEPRHPLPKITVVIPAFNEQEVLATKLDNTLGQAYPPERLEVLVVSDGSTDRTDRIVRDRISLETERDGPRLRLLRLPRGGKARALNAAAADAEGEILVLTDANALLAPGALAALIFPFADSAVGGVCGRKGFRRGLFTREPGDSTAEGEGLYWRWDQWQKSLESRIGSVFAADGALYAVRRGLYVPIEDPAQADDIAISTRVVLQGYRLVEAPQARVFEEPPGEGRQELQRKIRVTNHSVRALWLLGRNLWTRGFYSVELLSHKLLRHLAPFLLIPLFVTSLVLAPGAPGLAAALAVQVVVYGLAALGFALRHTRLGRASLLSIPYYFSMVNVAAFLGVLSLLRGERRSRWTPRQGLEP